MALMLARESFLRRREIFVLWVVPGDAIARAERTDKLFRLAKTYREVSDYLYLVAKWRQYHQQAMTPETMAEHEPGRDRQWMPTATTWRSVRF